MLSTANSFQSDPSNNFVSEMDPLSGGGGIYDSVSSSHTSNAEVQGQPKQPSSKPQSLYKVNLDGTKIRGRWAVVCVDFDRIMP